MKTPAALAPGRVLVCGLGNPGARYAGTRHNIGFVVLDELARRWGGELRPERRVKALGAELRIADRPAVLLQPLTFMNLSGEAVQPVLQFWKLPPEQLVVVHDELDLPPGRVRLKFGGGHGGHNGLRSIAGRLSSPHWYRVRVGIGRPPEGGDVSGWVLGGFEAAEQEAVGRAVEDAADAVERLLADGLVEAQNVIHARG